MTLKEADNHSAQAIFEALMLDPDLEIAEGQTREEAAKNEAEYRARQHFNNMRALSLGTEDSPIKALNSFLSRPFFSLVNTLNIVKAKLSMDSTPPDHAVNSVAFYNTQLSNDQKGHPHTDSPASLSPEGKEFTEFLAKNGLPATVMPVIHDIARAFQADEDNAHDPDGWIDLVAEGINNPDMDLMNMLNQQSLGGTWNQANLHDALHKSENYTSAPFEQKAPTVNHSFFMQNRYGENSKESLEKPASVDSINAALAKMDRKEEVEVGSTGKIKWKQEGEGDGFLGNAGQWKSIKESSQKRMASRITKGMISSEGGMEDNITQGELGNFTVAEILRGLFHHTDHENGIHDIAPNEVAAQETIVEQQEDHLEQADEEEQEIASEAFEAGEIEPLTDNEVSELAQKITFNKSKGAEAINKNLPFQMQWWGSEHMQTPHSTALHGLAQEYGFVDSNGYVLPEHMDKIHDAIESGELTKAHIAKAYPKDANGKSDFSKPPSHYMLTVGKTPKDHTTPHKQHLGFSGLHVLIKKHGMKPVVKEQQAKEFADESDLTPAGQETGEVLPIPTEMDDIVENHINPAVSASIALSQHLEKIGNHMGGTYFDKALLSPEHDGDLSRLRGYFNQINELTDNMVAEGHTIGFATQGLHDQLKMNPHLLPGFTAMIPEDSPLFNIKDYASDPSFQLTPAQKQIAMAWQKAFNASNQLKNGDPDFNSLHEALSELDKCKNDFGLGKMHPKYLADCFKSAGHDAMANFLEEKITDSGASSIGTLPELSSIASLKDAAEIYHGHYDWDQDQAALVHGQIDAIAEANEFVPSTDIDEETNLADMIKSYAHWHVTGNPDFAAPELANLKAHYEQKYKDINLYTMQNWDDKMSNIADVYHSEKKKLDKHLLDHFGLKDWQEATEEQKELRHQLHNSAHEAGASDGMFNKLDKYDTQKIKAEHAIRSWLDTQLEGADGKATSLEGHHEVASKWLHNEAVHLVNSMGTIAESDIDHMIGGIVQKYSKEEREHLDATGTLAAVQKQFHDAAEYPDLLQDDDPDGTAVDEHIAENAQGHSIIPEEFDEDDYEDEDEDQAPYPKMKSAGVGFVKVGNPDDWSEHRPEGAEQALLDSIHNFNEAVGSEDEGAIASAFKSVNHTYEKVKPHFAGKQENFADKLIDQNLHNKAADVFFNDVDMHNKAHEAPPLEDYIQQQSGDGDPEELYAEDGVAPTSHSTDELWEKYDLGDHVQNVGTGAGEEYAKEQGLSIEEADAQDIEKLNDVISQMQEDGVSDSDIKSAINEINGSMGFPHNFSNIHGIKIFEEPEEEEEPEEPEEEEEEEEEEDTPDIEDKLDEIPPQVPEEDEPATGGELDRMKAEVMNEIFGRDQDSKEAQKYKKYLDKQKPEKINSLHEKHVIGGIEKKALQAKAAKAAAKVKAEQAEQKAAEKEESDKVKAEEKAKQDEEKAKQKEADTIPHKASQIDKKIKDGQNPKQMARENMVHQHQHGDMMSSKTEQDHKDAFHKFEDAGVDMDELMEEKDEHGDDYGSEEHLQAAMKQDAKEEEQAKNYKDHIESDHPEHHQNRIDAFNSSKSGKFTLFDDQSGKPLNDLHMTRDKHGDSSFDWHHPGEGPEPDHEGDTHTMHHDLSAKDKHAIEILKTDNKGTPAAIGAIKHLEEAGIPIKDVLGQADDTPKTGPPDPEVARRKMMEGYVWHEETRSWIMRENLKNMNGSHGANDATMIHGGSSHGMGLAKKAQPFALNEDGSPSNDHFVVSHAGVHKVGTPSSGKPSGFSSHQHTREASLGHALKDTKVGANGAVHMPNALSTGALKNSGLGKSNQIEQTPQPKSDFKSAKDELKNTFKTEAGTAMGKLKGLFGGKGTGPQSGQALPTQTQAHKKDSALEKLLVNYR